MVSPDGKHAEATGGEYDIVVKNPLDSSALVEVGIGHGTTASVSAAQASRHLLLSNPKAGGPGRLAHTGANLPLLAGGGFALLLGAGYLRRRQMV
jgi:LPXTG-motif cell wall-anchored protein